MVERFFEKYRDEDYENMASYDMILTMNVIKIPGDDDPIKIVTDINSLLNKKHYKIKNILSIGHDDVIKFTIKKICKYENKYETGICVFMLVMCMLMLVA